MNATCTHRKRVKADDSIVCAACGIVLEVDALVDNTLEDSLEDRNRLWLELSTSRRVPLQSPVANTRILHDLVRSICSHFSISSGTAGQANELVERALQEKIINRGRVGRRAAAAAVYLLCRSNATTSAITISDLAGLMGERPTDLFQSLTVMRPLVLQMIHGIPTQDPSSFLERIIQRLAIDESHRRDVLQMSLQLCDFADDCALSAGRKAEALAVAIVLLSMESLLLITKKTRDYRRFMRQACVVCEQSLDTVTLRLNELRDALCEEVQHHPLLADVADNVNRSNIGALGGDILRYRALEDTPSTRRPIAFTRSEQIAERRKQQIREALERIDDGHSERKDTAPSIEDLVIERLLLHHVPAYRIEAASSLPQLYSIEEELFLDTRLDDQECLLQD